MKVLLLTNYPPDRQHSMLRFGSLLADGLSARGVNVEVFGPQQQIASGVNTKKGFGKWLGYVDKYILFPGPLKQTAASFDLVHICDQSNALYSRYLQHIPHLVTCHDLLAVRGALGENTYCPASPTGKLLQKMILKGLKTSDFIVCDSTSTLTDVQRLTGRHDENHLAVVPLAANPLFQPATAGEIEEQLSNAPLLLAKPFVLHVGSSEPRKNHQGVLRIFSKIAGKFDGFLVFAGSPLSEANRQLAQQLELQSRLVEIVEPSDDVLKALYTKAFAFVFPSLYEGFGRPVLEAQACGCPVIASNSGPLPEVLGSSAPLFTAQAEDDFAGALLNLQDAETRNRAVALGFDNVSRFGQEAMISKYIDLYDKLIESSVRLT